MIEIPKGTVGKTAAEVAARCRRSSATQWVEGVVRIAGSKHSKTRKSNLREKRHGQTPDDVEVCPREAHELLSLVAMQI